MAVSIHGFNCFVRFLIVAMLLAWGRESLASIQTVPLSSSAFASAQPLNFNATGSVASHTNPIGLSVFVSNSFFNTSGISGAFTGNASAPITPPNALSLGGSPGPATYFHFSPLPGYEIFSIGLSATSAVINQSTTFRTFAANQDSESIQFDTTMTPTGGGIAGLNGGAVFLGVSSQPSPITSFRVWQLDDGFGVLDNLVVDIRPIASTSEVPEPASFAAWLLLTAASVFTVRRRSNRLRRCITNT